MKDKEMQDIYEQMRHEQIKRRLIKAIFAEMGDSRGKAMDKVSNMSENIYVHLFKIQMYHHQKEKDVEHWIEEIYTWTNKIHRIKFKASNKRIPLKDVKLWMEDGWYEVRMNNYSILATNVTRELMHITHPPYPKPDKEFEINEESAKAYINTMNQIMWFMSAENKLENMDYDELYNCICTGFNIHL